MFIFDLFYVMISFYLVIYYYRYGFDALPKPNVTIEIPSLEIMTKVLKREEELRLSDKYQAMFANPGLKFIS